MWSEIYWNLTSKSFLKPNSEFWNDGAPCAVPSLSLDFPDRVITSAPSRCITSQWSQDRRENICKKFTLSPFKHPRKSSKNHPNTGVFMSFITWNSTTSPASALLLPLRLASWDLSTRKRCQRWLEIPKQNGGLMGKYTVGIISPIRVVGLGAGIL